MAIGTGRVKPKYVKTPVRVAEATDTQWWSTPGGSQTSKVGESRGTTPAVPTAGMAGTTTDFGTESNVAGQQPAVATRPNPIASGSFYGPLSNAIAGQVMSDAAKQAQTDASNYISQNDALAALIAQLYGSSGSSGGSGSSAQAVALQNMRGLAEMLAKQLSSGSYKEPYQRLNKRLGRQYRGARQDIRSEYAKLEDELRALQSNPYQGFEAQAGVAEPGLMDYLSQMGGDTTGLGAEVAGGREAAAQQAAAFNNVARMLAAQQAASNTGRLSDVAQSRAGSIADLLAQRAAFGAGVTTQEEAARQNLYQLLSQLGLQGVNIGGLL